MIASSVLPSTKSDKIFEINSFVVIDFSMCVFGQSIGDDFLGMFRPFLAIFASADFALI